MCCVYFKVDDPLSVLYKKFAFLNMVELIFGQGSNCHYGCTSVDSYGRIAITLDVIGSSQKKTVGKV